MMAEARRDLAAGGTIADRAVILDLQFGAPSITRRMDSGKVQTDADKDLVKVSKDILDSPEVKALTDADGAIRQWLRDPKVGQGFGRVVGRGGMYLIPLERFGVVDERLTEYLERERPALLAAVERTYDQRVIESQRRLRSEAAGVCYLSRTEFVAALYSRVRYITFSVPGNLPDAVQVREKARLDELWREVEADVRYALREGFAELVDHAVDRLNGGKQTKKFRNEAWTERWGAFFETFSGKNLTGDADLARLVDAARKLIGGVDPQELKDDGRLRKGVLNRLREVKAEVDALLEDGPVRVIRE